MLARALAALRRRTRTWARKRHGIDSDPLTLSGRRIYIVPSSLGIAFALMLFAMFLGAMNYANNLALGLTFMLGALSLTAMHYCHRNLAGVQIRSAASEPVFAGQTARFRIALENDAKVARHELTVANEHGIASPAPICPPGSEDSPALGDPANCQTVFAPRSDGARLVPDMDGEIRLTYRELTALIEAAVRELK